MAVTAPDRPRRAPEFDEPERLEALISEARRRARLRRLRYATLVVLVASAGAAAVVGPGGGGGAGRSAAPEPATAASEIKLAGARLAYVPVRGGVLYVTKPDGSGARVVARCKSTGTPCVIRNPAWSPDGRRIAFLRGRLSPQKRGGDLAMYVIGLDGRGERRVVECGGVDGICGIRWGSRLSWSPDGSRIALSRGGNLSIVDVKNARVRWLTRCGRGCFDIDPAWSPDQTAIAFTRVMEKEWAGEVYRVSVSSRPRLTSLAIYGRNPGWSRDGRTLLVDTLAGMVRVRADGSQTFLTGPRNASDGLSASWSPDRRRVLYFSTRYESRSFTSEVWTMRADGTRKKRLYGGPCCVTKAVWSPDGKRVALSISDPVPRGDRAGIFVIHTNGRELRNLSRLTADLAWQPTPVATGETQR